MLLSNSADGMEENLNVLSNASNVFRNHLMLSEQLSNAKWTI